MSVAFELRLKTPLGRIQGRLLLPEQARLGEFAWNVMQLDEVLVAQAVRFDLRQGDKSVSCGKGCGACCRQLVPLSGPEAFLIARLVAALPPDRRTPLLARMAAVRARATAAGFDAVFRTAQFKALAMAYFAAGESCPFLAEECCSIHADRPFVCREFLVTSSPSLCGNAARFGEVRAVPLTVRMTDAMATLAGELFAEEPAAVPLFAAVEWTVAHREQAERRFECARLLSRLIEIIEAGGRS